MKDSNSTGHTKARNSLATNKPRRKALKHIAIGGGVASTTLAMPGKWTRPVINSVLLPAHADTTNTDSSTTGIENITYYDDITSVIDSQSFKSHLDSTTSRQLFAQGGGGSKSVFDGVLDAIVPDAQAQVVALPVAVKYFLCIRINGTVVSVDFVEVVGDSIFVDVMSGTGTLGNAINLPAFCPEHIAVNWTIIVTDPTPDNVDYELTVGKNPFGKVALPANPCMVPVSICTQVVI